MILINSSSSRVMEEALRTAAEESPLTRRPDGRSHPSASSSYRLFCPRRDILPLFPSILPCVEPVLAGRERLWGESKFKFPKSRIVQSRDTSTRTLQMSKAKVGEDLWKNRVEKVVCLTIKCL